MLLFTLVLFDAIVSPIRPPLHVSFNKSICNTRPVTHIFPHTFIDHHLVFLVHLVYLLPTAFVEEFFDIGMDHDTDGFTYTSSSDFDNYMPGQGQGLGQSTHYQHGAAGAGSVIGVGGLSSPFTLDGCHGSDDSDDIICHTSKNGPGIIDDQEVNDQEVKPPMDKKEG